MWRLVANNAQPLYTMFSFSAKRLHDVINFTTDADVKGDQLTNKDRR